MKTFLYGLLFAAFLGLTFPASIAKADDTGFAYMHDLRKERGKLCMTGHYHDGYSGEGRKSKAGARRAAIRSWQEFTDFEYGSDWARFSLAASKSMRCDKSSGLWICDVEARPCRRGKRRRR